MLGSNGHGSNGHGSNGHGPPGAPTVYIVRQWDSEDGVWRYRINLDVNAYLTAEQRIQYQGDPELEVARNMVQQVVGLFTHPELEVEFVDPGRNEGAGPEEGET